MSTSAPRAESLAQRLLDAQVTHHVDRLTGEQLAGTVSRIAEGLMAAAGQHQIDDLIDRAAIKDIVRRSLVTVPRMALTAAVAALRSLPSEVSTLSALGRVNARPLVLAGRFVTGQAE